MTYYVTYRLEARYIAEVEAGSPEDAVQMAEEKYMDADFGEASEIDGSPIIVEDENGNFVFEA